MAKNTKLVFDEEGDSCAYSGKLKLDEVDSIAQKLSLSKDASSTIISPLFVSSDETIFVTVKGISFEKPKKEIVDTVLTELQYI